MLSLSPTQSSQWLSVTVPTTAYRYCQNFEHGACNWLIPDSSPETLCLACQLNQTIPDLSQPAYLAQWQKLESAKHRLIYSLLRLQLPVVNKSEDATVGLGFNFLADTIGKTNPETGKPEKVTTGHQNGIITINIAEADDAKREKLRQSLAEPYRTLLGHFRHEIAHYYWTYFAQSEDWLNAFRTQFGDDRQDYGTALAEHYAQSQDTAWQATHISSYAAAHPWEDWAETWAHYLHIIDTLEIAYAFGMNIDPGVTNDKTLSANVAFDAYQQIDFARLIDTWLPITFALNSLNRAMGHGDLYPFILTPAVMTKLEFIHDTVHRNVNQSLCKNVICMNSLCGILGAVMTLWGVSLRSWLGFFVSCVKGYRAFA